MTTGMKRADNLWILARQEECALFWFTMRKALRRDGPLAPIWLSPFADRPLCLLAENMAVS